MGDNPYSEDQRMSDANVLRGRNSILTHLDMELTERCNNNCIHCLINIPANDSVARQRELSTEEIKGIIEEAVSLGCLVLKLTGGEPLLRRDFEDIYVFARKAGLRVIIFTNATLITPHLAELFARIPPLEKIQVTVYGMKEESYAAVARRPGGFKAARRGIDLLLEKKIPFVVKRAILPPNADELDEFEKWASTLPWMDKAPRYSMFFDLRSRRDSEEKNRLIRGLRPSSEDALKILTRDDDYLKNMKEFCSRFMVPPGDELFLCGAGFKSGYVDAYGYFQPCTLLKHPDTVYNLRNGSLKDALTEFFPKVRRMKSTNTDYLARCVRCFLKGICEQCPAKSWAEHGTLDTPVEYLCEIAHGKARHLGLLETGEVAWEVADWRERLKEFAETEVMPSEIGTSDVE